MGEQGVGVIPSGKAARIDQQALEPPLAGNDRVDDGTDLQEILVIDHAIRTDGDDLVLTQPFNVDHRNSPRQ